MKLCHTCGNEITDGLRICPFCGDTQQSTSGPKRRPALNIATLNLKQGLPTVDEAILKLERELVSLKHSGVGVVRVIHGWGSSGTGGKIKAAFHKLFAGKLGHKDIRSFLPGEHYSDKNTKGRELLEAYPLLRSDLRTDRNNPGITFIEL